jgi:type II secretory pathway predicted ATPase ExeA
MARMNKVHSRFGLTKDPFSKDVPIDEFFEHVGAAAALKRLKAALEGRASAVLTGEPGTGKTFVLRALEEKLPQGRFRFTYIHNSHVNVRDFYRQLSVALGLEPRATPEALFRAVSHHVEETACSKVHAVLLLDEAQLLAVKVLEHLPLLLNFQKDSKPFLSVVLVGLPELRRRLSRNLLYSLAARLPVRIHLDGVSPQVVAAYLSHRLKMAGSAKEVFAEDAVLMIAEATSGSLRKIDVLAGHALEVSTEGKSAIVDAGVIEKAVKRCAEALL